MNNSAIDDQMVGRDAGQRASARWVAGLLSLIGVALAMRLFELTSHSLWFDEGLSLDAAQPTATIGGFFASLAERGPGQLTQPLYFFLLHLWIKVAGASDASLRLLSVLLGTAAVAVTAIAATQVFGRRHALWATAFMATSGFAVYYSQEIRPYALLMLLTALLLWAHMRIVTAPRLSIGLVMALTVTTAVALTGSFIFAFFLTALALADLLVTFRLAPGRAKRWFLTWLGPGLAALPILAAYLAFWPSTSTVSAPPNPLLNLFYVPFGLVVGQTFGPPLDTLRGDDVVRVVLARWPQLLALAAAGLALLVQLHRLASSNLQGPTLTGLTAARVLALSIVLSYLIGVVMVFGLDFNWLPRRAFYLLVPLALVLPIAASGEHRRGLATTIPLAGLILLNLVSVYAYYFDPTHRRDEYREALNYLTTSQDPSTPAVVLEGNMDVVRHYGRHDVLDGVAIVKSANFMAALAELAGDPPAVSVVIARDWDFRRRFDGPNDRSFLDVMAEGWVLESRQSFVAVDVYHFTAKLESD